MCKCLLECCWYVKGVYITTSNSNLLAFICTSKILEMFLIPEGLLTSEEEHSQLESASALLGRFQFWQSDDFVAVKLWLRITFWIVCWVRWSFSSPQSINSSDHQNKIEVNSYFASLHWVLVMKTNYRVSSFISIYLQHLQSTPSKMSHHIFCHTNSFHLGLGMGDLLGLRDLGLTITTVSCMLDFCTLLWAQIDNSWTKVNSWNM